MKKQIFALIVLIMLTGMLAISCAPVEKQPVVTDTAESSEVTEEVAQETVEAAPEAITEEVSEGISDISSTDEELDTGDIDTASDALADLDW